MGRTCKRTTSRTKTRQARIALPAETTEQERTACLEAAEKDERPVVALKQRVIYRSAKAASKVFGGNEIVVRDILLACSMASFQNDTTTLAGGEEWRFATPEECELLGDADKCPLPSPEEQPRESKERNEKPNESTAKESDGRKDESLFDVVRRKTVNEPLYGTDFQFHPRDGYSLDEVQIAFAESLSEWIVSKEDRGKTPLSEVVDGESLFLWRPRTGMSAQGAMLMKAALLDVWNQAADQIEVVGKGEISPVKKALRYSGEYLELGKLGVIVRKEFVEGGMLVEDGLSALRADRVSDSTIVVEYVERDKKKAGKYLRMLCHVERKAGSLAVRFGIEACFADAEQICQEAKYVPGIVKSVASLTGQPSALQNAAHILQEGHKVCTEGIVLEEKSIEDVAELFKEERRRLVIMLAASSSVADELRGLFGGSAVVVEKRAGVNVKQLTDKIADSLHTTDKGFQLKASEVDYWIPGSGFGGKESIKGWKTMDPKNKEEIVGKLRRSYVVDESDIPAAFDDPCWRKAEELPLPAEADGIPPKETQNDAALRCRPVPTELPGDVFAQAERCLQMAKREHERLLGENRELAALLADREGADSANAEMLDDLHKENAALYGKSVSALKRENADLRKALDASRDAFFTMDEFPTSPQEVLKLASQVFADRLLITDECVKEAWKESTHTANVWRVVRSLAVDLWELKYGEGAYSPNEGRLEDVFENRTGFEMSLHESDTVKTGRAASEARTFVLGGRKRMVEPHIKASWGQGSRAPFRCFFDFDDEKRQIVVFYAGEHKTTSSTKTTR